MTTKITVIYDAPQNPADFEAAYAEHMAFAAGIPGLQRVETHRRWPFDCSHPVLAYRLDEFYFENSARLREASGIFLPTTFKLGANGVQIAYQDEEPPDTRLILSSSMAAGASPSSTPAGNRMLDTRIGT